MANTNKTGIVKSYKNTVENTTEYRKLLKSLDWTKIREQAVITLEFLNGKNGYPISNEEVKDVVQDAIYKILTNSGTFNPAISKFSTWTNRIIANCYYDAIALSTRKQRAFRPFREKERKEDVYNGDVMECEFDSPDYTTDIEAFDSDFEGLLNKVLDPLCETYRNTILCLVEERAKIDALQIMNCSEKNYYPTVSRARREARKSCRALGLI